VTGALTPTLQHTVGVGCGRRRCVQKCGGDLAEGLSAAFKLMDEKWTELVRPQFLAGDVDLAMMGSCSLVCIVRQGKLVVANAGDSRAAVVRHLPTSPSGGGGSVLAFPSLLPAPDLHLLPLLPTAHGSG
jgi:hypothetical protein